MIIDVCGQYHLNHNLSNVPVLSLTKQLEDVVLGIEKQLECDGAMMILKNGDIIVPNGLLMFHSNQEVIVHTRMRHIMHEAGKETRHYL